MIFHYCIKFPATAQPRSAFVRRHSAVAEVPDFVDAVLDIRSSSIRLSNHFCSNQSKYAVWGIIVESLIQLETLDQREKEERQQPAPTARIDLTKGRGEISARDAFSGGLVNTHVEFGKCLANRCGWRVRDSEKASVTRARKCSRLRRKVEKHSSELHDWARLDSLLGSSQLLQSQPDGSIVSSLELGANIQ